MSYNNNGYISPQQIMQAQGYNQQSSRHNQGHRDTPVTARSSRSVDPSLLTPGVVHNIPYQLRLSPEMVLNGHQIQTYHAPLFILPRSQEYIDTPSIASITFSVQGEPAPFIKAIMKGTVVVDGPHDCIFQELGWKRTDIVVNVHGATAGPERLRTINADKSPLTRETLSLELCGRIFQFFVKYPAVAREINWRKIRLVALSYYRNVWAPIMALDA
ncbi:hypothetical protein BDZ94DRAFT_1299567 [Collybia nuda]|uniref:Uncharacterized protein n=1 Tax=Collybia nuda TaxID=64659 RepID=A0A9P5XZZ5_9AGAR|nr:hypothetical protein BDZ94DRAFT_1299567 [Collybia nuda]